MRDGEAESVLDITRGVLVVAHQTGEDGQTSAVGGRPGIGALFVSQQVPDGGGVGVPTAVAVRGRVAQLMVVQLIEEAVGVIQNVPLVQAIIRVVNKSKHERESGLQGERGQRDIVRHFSNGHETGKRTLAAWRAESGQGQE
jgi:hypothetical protein